MKFLPLRILSSLLCVASMLFSSVPFAQTNCTKHLGGETTCTDVEEKNFVKADELKQLLWQEQFKNATTDGRVHMFNEERAEKRLEMMQSLDRLEKRIRWENRPATLTQFHKFKEMALKSYEENEAKIDKAFKEQLLIWKDEDESNARFARLEADMAALKASEQDPVEYQKKEDELLEQWGKAEDKQKQRITAALEKQLDRLVAEEAIQRKVKNKKATVR